jgi:predicted GNAT superfamily acetyltransferase
MRHENFKLHQAGSIACGLRSDHALAVWDMNLEREAKALGIKAHNLLWIFDQMDVHGHENPELLHQALKTITARNNCTLSKSGVRSRLVKWEKRI